MTIVIWVLALTAIILLFSARFWDIHPKIFRSFSRVKAVADLLFLHTKSGLAGRIDNLQNRYLLAAHRSSIAAMGMMKNIE